MNLNPLFLTAATETTEPALDIDSIKAALDGFDPGALLPELSRVFSSIATVCRIAVLVGPVVLLVLGLAYLLLAPKEANYYFGYRCYFGMGSVGAWRFTQRLAGMILGALGLVLTVVMLLLSRGFSAMDPTALAWKTLSCLIWEGVIALLANAAIHITAAALFDRKGNFRHRAK